ncbi:CPBP family intramembrane glutamic endopeptidase [Microbispora sp. ATCC PTA-5024]|uniref:CPBP family intramembrane glutamic endopeptidase n=1 Tax=Microbispora sp. ATCC PTA-5024 TaxID=316330 RepID=UPI0003DC22BD|nr:CPBP family intramembrane glutamic endopeptidase [Microbispora sp. ATCC PTA-5024]ETK36225.1 abortive infection protein [Microbispora sp. ATCC PTA-5024]
MRSSRDLLLFLLVAFGASWAAAIPLWLSGAPLGSPAVLVTGLVMMLTPSLGVLAVWRLCRRGTPFRAWARETGLTLGPDRPATARLLVVAWLGVPALVAVAAAVGVAAGTLHLDLAGLSLFRREAGQALAKAPIDPRVLLALQVVEAVVFAPLINAVPALGEEWGWRGWLLPRLLNGPGGGGDRGRLVRALLLSGVIWGLWHAPLTLRGYDYPSLGPWAASYFVGFCVLFGVVLGWLRLRSGSVWPAAIGHGALNATAAVPLLLGDAAHPPNPALAGVLGLPGLAVLAVTALVALRAGRFPSAPVEREAAPS